MLRDLLPTAAVLAVASTGGCALIADFEFTAATGETGGSGAEGNQGGGGQGASSTGASGGEGGIGNQGGGGTGGTPPADPWVVSFDGHARLHSVSIDPITDDVFVAGLYKGSFESLPAPPGSAWGSFVARISSEGDVQWVKAFAADAGTLGALPIYDPDVDVFVTNDEVFVAATSNAGADVALLDEAGAGHAKPYAIWGSFTDRDLEQESFQQLCELDGFAKSVEVEATLDGTTAAMIFAGSTGIDCSWRDDMTSAQPLNGETMVLLQRLGGAVSTPFPLSNIAGVRSAPNLAITDGMRVFSGNFDQVSLHGIQYCGNGTTPSPTCTLGSDFGAFVGSFDPNGLHYAGSIQPASGPGFGGVAVDANGNDVFVALTHAAQPGAGGSREVEVFRYTTTNLTSVYTSNTSTDEKIARLHRGSDRTLLVGTLSQSYVYGGGVEDFTTGGCADDNADTDGDAFWMVLDAQNNLQAGAGYGDCEHQEMADGTLDSQNNIIVGGNFIGSLTASDDSTIMSSGGANAPSVFVMRIPAGR